MTPKGTGRPPDKPLRVCTVCTPRHYENCPTCYGFGLRNDGLPLGTSQLDTPAARDGFRICPTCKSGPTGLPT